ncbi:DUF2933 domain-containing protein [Desulfofustis glycolicus]|uniref:DUF2933 domain-containing protein n=1 Tax=Desulfofustis glycolicus DSM 9705 TaxID=1121409 RepID=A0A1M5XJ71_9BACT|nr:DUF2933 domain-containing protein [Desulfofustis glycolicus]SHH99861.1 Protein of unknown function [Desulfofustis glycolicus DSM 9705]
MNSLQKSMQWLSRRSLNHILLAGVVLAGGFIVVQRHQEHVVAFLPYLIFLLCPLMHIFMHGGHGAPNSRHQGEREDG